MGLSEKERKVNIGSVVNKINNVAQDCTRKVASSITQKTASMNANGVAPSKVLEYLNCRAKGFLYFDRLNKTRSLMEDFHSAIKMSDLAKQHFYVGLEADTVQIGSFAQKTNDFMLRVQEAKNNPSEVGLIETIRKLIDLDMIKFTKLDSSDYKRDVYLDDPNKLEEFKKLLSK